MLWTNTSDLATPLNDALCACASLIVAHGVSCAIIMYMDLTGRWAAYSLHEKRAATFDDYWIGWKSFITDQMLLFLPFMTFCFWFSGSTIHNCTDAWYTSFFKLGFGFALGKLWAYVIHYCLHFPCLYSLHKRHHMNPRRIVASGAWLDSLVEYSLMELPSFGITILVAPTHLFVHLFHFVWHGVEAAGSHSGYAGAPGILGWIYDGEYHFHHHNLLTVNYAEMEFLDYIFHTHLSQKPTAERPKRLTGKECGHFHCKKETTGRFEANDAVF
jgi:hypothetical protein